MDRLTLSVSLILLLFATSGQAQDPSSTTEIIDGYSLAGSTGEALTGFNTASHVTPRGGDVVPGCGPLPPLFGARKWGHRYRVYGGYEIGWLQPRFTENVSVVVSRPSGNRALSFDHPYESSPRFWVGIQNANCTGIRARYWYLNTDAERQVAFATGGATSLSLSIEGGGGNLRRTAVANLGEVMTSDHHLEMRTIDLEGTQRIELARTQMLASFGLRYAETRQRAHAVATGGAGLTELVCQDLTFDGFGPTVGIELTRCLCVGPPLIRRLSIYGGARGSILFGQQRQELVLVTSGGATLAEDEYVHDDLLPIAELSAGLQLRAQPFGCGLWTLRSGYRADSWFGVGGPVETASNVGLHGIILSLAASW